MNTKLISIKSLSLLFSGLIIILGFLATHNGPTIIDGNIHDVMIPKIAAQAFNEGIELHKDIKSGFGYFYFLLHGVTQSTILSSSGDYLKNHNSTANFLFLFVLFPFYFALKKLKLFDPKYSVFILPFLLTLVFSSIDIGDYNHKVISWYASYNYHAWSLYFLLLFSTFYLIFKNSKEDLSDRVFYSYSLISGLIFGFLLFYKFNYAIGIGAIFVFGMLQTKTITRSIKYVLVFFGTIAIINIVLMALGYDIPSYLSNIKEISSVRGGTLAFKNKVKAFLALCSIYVGWVSYKNNYFSKFSNLVNLKTLAYIGLAVGFALCFVGDFNQPITLIFVLILLVMTYERSFILYFISREYVTFIGKSLTLLVLAALYVALSAQIRVVTYKFKDVTRSNDKEMITLNSLRPGLPAEDHYVILKNIYGYADIADHLNYDDEHIVLKFPDILPTSDKMFELKDYVKSLNESTEYIARYNTPENIAAGENTFFVIEFTNHAYVLNDNVKWPKSLLHWLHPGTTISIKNKETSIPAYEDSNFVFVPLIGVDSWTNKLGCHFLDYNKKNRAFTLIDSGKSWLIYSKNSNLINSKIHYLKDLEDQFLLFCAEVEKKGYGKK